MKDIKMLAGILGVLAIVVPAAWGVFAKSWEHKDLQVHFAEMSREFRQDQIERQITGAQQRQWQFEDRLEQNPNDAKAKRELKQAQEQEEMLKKKLDAIQQKEGK